MSDADPTFEAVDRGLRERVKQGRGAELMRLFKACLGHSVRAGR